MTKILFDATFLNLYHSGIYFAARNILLQLMRRKKMEITLFFSEVVPQNEIRRLYQDFPEAGFLQIEKNSQHCQFWGRRELLLANRICKSRSRWRSILLRMKRKFCYKLKTHYTTGFDGSGYDVYFSPYSAPPKRIAGNSAVKKYVLLYDVVQHILPQFFPEKERNSGWFKQLTDSLCRTTGYFSISECTKRDFLRFFPEQLDAEKITVIPLGSHQNFSRQTDMAKSRRVLEKYGVGEGQKYFFSLCSIEPRKNLLHSVECFANFMDVQNEKELLFLLGGAPFDNGDAMQKHIRERLLEIAENYPQVRMIGYVPDEDLAILYSNAECFVYCSLYEGFGLPILEAMRCGCPVICSNTSSMPEVAGDAALLVDPAQNDQLIDAMKQVHQDEALRSRMRKAGLCQAEKFSYEKAAEIIAETICQNVN